MEIVAWLGLGGAIVLLYVWYATIVKRRNRVTEALAGIDVQLQQRHDLIPNVLTIARRFMEHEGALLTEITNLRSKAHQQVGERDFAKVAEKFEVEGPARWPRATGSSWRCPRPWGPATCSSRRPSGSRPAGRSS